MDSHMNDASARSGGDALLTAWERSWPHITALIDAGGHVTIGKVEPFESVAVAASERKIFATLVRRKGESAADLMQRLEVALDEGACAGVTSLDKTGAMSRSV